MKKILALIFCLLLCVSIIGCSSQEMALFQEILSAVTEPQSKPKTEFDTKTLKQDYPLLVHFLDVGQADSAFCELPDGKTLLIDAGNPENGKDIIEFAQKLGYDRIDYVVATHPHSDHIGGMAEVLKEFDIGAVFMPKKEHTTASFENMIDVIAEKEIPLYSAKKGAVIAENDLYKITILSPEERNYDNLNNYSAVVKLAFGDTKFLFMGDAEREIETRLKKLDISADVIKLGHHGSSTSSRQEFLQMVGPEFAVISCGDDNSYGHPHDEVIKRLDRLNIKYFRTDIDGTITVGAKNDKNLVVNKELTDGN